MTYQILFSNLLSEGACVDAENLIEFEGFESLQTHYFYFHQNREANKIQNKQYLVNADCDNINLYYAYHIYSQAKPYRQYLITSIDLLRANRVNINIYYAHQT